MKKSSLALAAIAVAAALTAACSSTYQSRPQMEYYRGQNIPEGFVRVVSWSPTQVQFGLRVNFKESHLYHLVLDGNAPVAEGWFPTTRTVSGEYDVTLKAGKDMTFQAGKPYRLCIGINNPQAVQMTSSSYRCIAEYDFTLK